MNNDQLKFGLVVGFVAVGLAFIAMGGLVFLLGWTGYFRLLNVEVPSWILISGAGVVFLIIAAVLYFKPQSRYG